MMSLTKEDLVALIDGKLLWSDVKNIVSRPKDQDRFQQVLEILQARSGWKERILMPLTEHLYIVQKGAERIVRCDCGHEFGDYRCNWKLRAHILVRDDPESLEQIYPGLSAPNPELGELREFICPDCATLLKVESVPRGYPLIFDALPDLDGFYREWLGDPLAQSQEFSDMTLEIITEWRRTVA
ncbi:MAG: acetone carboxylase subunit gamma [Gammaproteobacteria bacterium]|nr:acetone carboxylase subunit gamma [Gammaproteobacteria bacterium]MBP6226936.1 acetone carboxylase subunit gamma [Pseudomonadales bacterium]MBK6584195.1 acetone carboxylase subunit gamma [Gammaproteobacteria bacterium]MBK7520379.1 acetone carboxylase subunit gamma [Gammaproteobacteria bacterium]MBK7728133.1 acetone carboxylase subunit gamma [Gammaproteobacteria bacterium]